MQVVLPSPGTFSPCPPSAYNAFTPDILFLPKTLEWGGRINSLLYSPPSPIPQIRKEASECPRESPKVPPSTAKSIQPRSLAASPPPPPPGISGAQRSRQVLSHRPTRPAQPRVQGSGQGFPPPLRRAGCNPGRRRTEGRASNFSPTQKRREAQGDSAPVLPPGVWSRTYCSPPPWPSP